jgi:putative ABC transport system ATP-binding protein
MTLAKLEGCSKVYGAQVKTVALAPTDLELYAGELTLLLGPSGSGKTTLLNLVGGLDAPSAGSVTVDGKVLGRLSRRELTLFRRASVGFVFQFFNLVPSLTASENVLVAGELAGARPEDVDALLEKVGLGGLGDRFPSELSGGQQQRVGIARALAKRPPLLLADEPTGALDHDAGAAVMGLLEEAVRVDRCGVVVVTHDEALVEVADRVIRLRDGRIVSDARRPARGATAGAAS